MGSKTDIKDKFYVGDRVIGCGTFDERDLTGMLGTIVDVYDYENGEVYWSVEFDKSQPGLHDCGGKAKSGYGWNCSCDVLELYVEPEEFEAPCLDGLFD